MFFGSFGAARQALHVRAQGLTTIGGLTIRLGFWGIRYVVL